MGGDFMVCGGSVVARTVQHIIEFQIDSCIFERLFSKSQMKEEEGDSSFCCLLPSLWRYPKMTCVIVESDLKRSPLDPYILWKADSSPFWFVVMNRESTWLLPWWCASGVQAESKWTKCVFIKDTWYECFQWEIARIMILFWFLFIPSEGWLSQE